MLTGVFKASGEKAVPVEPELPFLWRSQSSNRTYMRVGVLDILLGDHEGYTLQGIINDAHTSNTEAWKHRLHPEDSVELRNKPDPTKAKAKDTDIYREVAVGIKCTPR